MAPPRGQERVMILGFIGTARQLREARLTHSHQSHVQPWQHPGPKNESQPLVSLANQGNPERQDSLTVISLMHSHGNPKGPRISHNPQCHQHSQATQRGKTHSQSSVSCTAMATPRPNMSHNPHFHWHTCIGTARQLGGTRLTHSHQSHAQPWQPLAL